MRITSGIYGSRKLRVPDRGVRPTQDRVREALFSTLGDRVAGCRFLDLFAGSGAVGLEALSRGAEFVCLVEKNQKAFSTIRLNIESLDSALVSNKHKLRVIRIDAMRFLKKTGGPDSPYNLIYADPPYRMVGDGVLRKALQAIRTGHILAPDGLVVTEQRSNDEASGVEGWDLIQEKVYGEARLCYWRMI